METHATQTGSRRLSDRLLDLIVLLPVALWHIGKALFGIAIGLLIVLLLIKGA